MFSLEYLQELFHTTIIHIIDSLPQVGGAVIVLLVGWYAIRYVILALSKVMQKARIDTTVSKFLMSLIRIVLKVVLLIAVATMLGISMTSFVAILGAAGLAVGLSLQGSLSNFSGGIFLLVFKPYKVGDLVQIGQHLGHVKEISIMYTTIITLEKTTAILPNGPIMNDTIVNMNQHSIRRIQIPVGIAYDADIDLAKKILNELLDTHEKVLSDEPYGVFVSELGESSVDLVVRCFVYYTDFEPVKFDLTEQIKKTLDKHKIEIPFPQRVVHMKQV